MSKYQALIDALKAGPDNWTADKYGNLRNDSNESVRLNGVSLPCGRVTADDPSHKNTAYVLAANPATIRCLLADLERAGGALERVQRILRSTPYHVDKDELFAVVDAALSQLNGVQ